MTDEERVELAHSLIEVYSIRLSDLAHHIGIQDVGRVRGNLTAIFKDAFDDEVAAQLERNRREREFIESGEAAIENKADTQRDWYREAVMAQGNDE